MDNAHNKSADVERETVLFMSVIIIAYRRKQFLLQAVKSVLEQDYGREHFEVIVVKAFLDNEIDEFLSEHGVMSIYSDTESYGKSISEGLLKCKGDIVLLLDDDDMFRKDKLSMINKVFRENLNLTVAINSFKPIGDQERVNASIENFHKAERMLINKIGLVIWDFNSYDKRLMSKVGIFFNSSRISFRKELIPYLNGLIERISFMCDSVPAAIAMVNRMSIASVPDELTLYRIHNENASIFLGNEKQRLVRSHTKNMTDALTLSDFFSSLHSGISTDFLLLHRVEQLKVSVLKGDDRAIVSSAFSLFSILISNLKFNIRAFDKYYTSAFYSDRRTSAMHVIVNLLFVPVLIIFPKFFPKLGEKIRLMFPF
ncbi:MAG: glycosyltransferase [Thermoplasmatales archaeon]